MDSFISMMIPLIVLESTFSVLEFLFIVVFGFVNVMIFTFLMSRKFLLPKRKYRNLQIRNNKYSKKKIKKIKRKGWHSG